MIALGLPNLPKWSTILLMMLRGMTMELVGQPTLSRLPLWAKVKFEVTQTAFIEAFPIFRPFLAIFGFSSYDSLDIASWLNRRTPNV